MTKLGKLTSILLSDYDADRHALPIAHDLIDTAQMVTVERDLETGNFQVFMIMPDYGEVPTGFALEGAEPSQPVTVSAYLNTHAPEMTRIWVQEIT